MMRYIVLAFLVVAFLAPCATAKEPLVTEFKDWFGVSNTERFIATFSGSDNFELQVYIDGNNMHRLRFYPAKRIKIAKFVKRNGSYRRYPAMNFQSLYGYDHWIRKMKRDYYLHVWFEGHKHYEVFSLKGFAKAEGWLFK